MLVCRTTLYITPEGGRKYFGHYLYGKAVPSYQEVDSVGHYLGVGLHGAVITELLQITPVYSIRGYFAIMDHRPVQDVERMCPTPPTRGIGRESAVGCPQITLILLQAEILSYLLRVAYTLEHRHVFSAGEDKGVLKSGIDLHHPVYYIVIL